MDQTRQFLQGFQEARRKGMRSMQAFLVQQAPRVLGRNLTPYEEEHIHFTKAKCFYQLIINDGGILTPAQVQLLEAKTMEDVSQKNRTGYFSCMKILDDYMASNGTAIPDDIAESVRKQYSNRKKGDVMGKRPKVVILNNSATAVFRWLGKEGYEMKDAMKVAEHFGIGDDQLKKSTIQTCISDGRAPAGDYKIADLTREQERELLAIVKGEAANTKPKAKKVAPKAKKVRKNG